MTSEEKRNLLCYLYENRINLKLPPPLIKVIEDELKSMFLSAVINSIAQSITRYSKENKRNDINTK